MNGYVEFLDTASNTHRQSLKQSIDDTVRDTESFEPGSAKLRGWRHGPSPAEHHRHQSQYTVYIRQMSTLQGTQFLSRKCPSSIIGVLNFASATQPGGGFLSGANAQEESIARSSTLFRSLRTPQAKPFYDLHDRDDRGGYYSHAMIYSPSIAIFRDDDGQWIQPYHVSVVTSPAVNAGLVRKLTYSGSFETEEKILEVMKERMGRILALFELKETKNIVLGSFGTGVFQNDVFPLAEIWGGLLAAPQARYAHSFDNVVFAIPDSFTRQRFEAGFKAGANPSKSWLSRVVL